MGKSIRFFWGALLALLPLLLWLYPAKGARADGVCMIAPVGPVSGYLPVSGRFGKNRPGGAANHGGNPVPHTHDGLDFSTGGKKMPVYATADATVTLAQFLKGAGNTIRARRDDGSIMEYYHLDSFASEVKVGARITAGQQIGVSGNTGVSQIHLHFVYARPTASGQRAVNFSERASQYKGAFNPGQLPNALTNNKAGVGFRTDPAPFFCETFKIQDDGLYPYLTDNTKGQHQVLFGSVPPGGAQPNAKYDDAQVAAANADAVQAAAAGKPPEKWLPDTEGFGSLPSPPTGDYDSLSPLEMMLTESQRRFGDADWHRNVATVSSRALYVDYLRVVGTRNFITQSIHQKQEKIEALLAIYLTLKLKNQQQDTQRAAAEAVRKDAERSVR
ncbi:MAG: M23 family metallopeptidase [Azoarcus sp.]|jgi:hypothetical protein|nr:M23 family metallopeptidase [Azoarcus sp.]